MSKKLIETTGDDAKATARHAKIAREKEQAEEKEKSRASDEYWKNRRANEKRMEEIKKLPKEEQAEAKNKLCAEIKRNKEQYRADKKKAREEEREKRKAEKEKAKTSAKAEVAREEERVEEAIEESDRQEAVQGDDAVEVAEKVEETVDSEIEAPAAETPEEGASDKKE